MRKLALALLLLSPILGLAQAYYENTAINENGNPIPRAQVLVCAASDGAVPCTQLIAVYSSAQYAPLAQPIYADQHGFYSFYLVSTGFYRRQVYAAGTLLENRLFGINGGTAAGATGNLQYNNGGSLAGVNSTTDGTNVQFQGGLTMHTTSSDLFQGYTGALIFKPGNASPYTYFKDFYDTLLMSINAITQSINAGPGVHFAGDLTGNASSATTATGVTVNTPSNNATCTAGQMWADTGFIYVCTASGTVKRATLNTY